MGCCTFPQGRRAVFALLWSIFAYLFCVSATGGCYFMKIDGFLIQGAPFFVLEGFGSSAIGLFGYEEIGSDSNGLKCLAYNQYQLDNLLDGPWKAARAFGILANCSVGVTMVWLIFSSCIPFGPYMLRCLAGFSFLGSITIILTFVMFASKVSDEPQNGSFYFGGGMAIVGFICSLTTGLLVLQIKPASYDDDYVVSSPTGGSSDRASEGDTSAKPAGRNFPAPKRAQQDLPETAPEGDETNAFEPGTETVTETVMPDGSRKIIKTTVDMDGSKSVTETIVKQSE